nr:uncharacterized protein LOC108016402 [Drosophila suzukii]
MGIFTAPFISNLSFHWKATFVIKGHRGIFVSPLMPYPNEEGSASSILSNKQAQVYVNFVNINNELPKLKLLTLNGWELCSNKGYGNYSTTMTVKYTMDQHKIAQYRNLPMVTEPPRINNQNISIISME